MLGVMSSYDANMWYINTTCLAIVNDESQKGSAPPFSRPQRCCNLFNLWLLGCHSTKFGVVWCDDHLTTGNGVLKITPWNKSAMGKNGKGCIHEVTFFRHSTIKNIADFMNQILIIWNMQLWYFEKWPGGGCAETSFEWFKKSAFKPNKSNIRSRRNVV